MLSRMNRWSIALPFFVMVFSISSAIAQDQSAGPLIVGHRGAAHDAPENTLASFKLALEQGADGIESDFYLTADGQVISLHDATFKRTGGLDKKPSELTLAQIRELDVGSWKDPQYAGEKAPLLSEILAMLPKGKLFMMEIKCGPEIIPAFKKVVEASGVASEQLRIICFKSEVIAECKKQMPGIKAYWLTSFKAPKDDPTKHPTLPEVLKTLKKIHADGLDANADTEVITPDFVKAIKAEGYEFHVWTIDDPALAKQMIEAGAQSITTNRPGYLRGLLRP